MAYIYLVSFDINHNQMEQLHIGAALERTLGYLRTLLPNEPGYITARAMSSIDRSNLHQMMVESVWDQWQDLQAHQKSGLAEQKILTEFKPHVDIEDLRVRIYQEVQ
jgi:heme-degrading monooxygenase HmoA